MEVIVVVGVVLLFGFFVLVILTINASYDKSHHGQYPTFDQYKSQHPDLVNPGRVQCSNCGGSNIQARGLRSAVDHRKTHYCSTCGTVLYKSKS